MASKRVLLARARRAAGYTQEDLAHVLGVDRSTVGRWEAGETEPHAWHQPKLARALGVSRAELRGLLSTQDGTHIQDVQAPNPRALDEPTGDHHLAAALADASRFMDVTVVEYFH